jgi:hypothetical protein
MYVDGTANPVYTMERSVRVDTGARVCSILLVIEPTTRNSIDMAISVVNMNNQYVKKALASRRRLLMKYTGMWKRNDSKTFCGKMQIIDANISATG